MAQELLSLGFIAQYWQQPVRVVQAMLKSIEAEPILILNGVPHFAIEDVARAHYLLDPHDIAVRTAANG